MRAATDANQYLSVVIFWILICIMSIYLNIEAVSLSFYAIVFAFCVLVILKNPLIGVLLFPFSYIWTKLYIPYIGSGEKFIAILTLAAFLGSFLHRNSNRYHWEIRFNPVLLILYFIFFFFSIISLYSSHFSVGEGLENVFSFFSKGLTVYLVFRLISSKKDLDMCLYAIIFAVLITLALNVYVVVRYGMFSLRHGGLHLNYLDIFIKYSILCEVNVMSRFMLYSTPLLYVYAYQKRGYFRHFLLSVNIAQMFIPFIMISRTAVVTLVIIMGSTFARMKRYIHFGILGFIILVMFSYQPVVKRFQGVLSGSAYGVEKRVNLSKEGIALWKKRPLLGWGMGTKVYQFDPEGRPLQVYTKGVTDHNTYISILVETGILGLLFFLFLYIYMIFYLIRNYLRMKSSSIYKELLFPFLVILTFTSILMLTAPMIRENILWYFFGMALAIIKVYRIEEKEDDQLKAGV